jgi:hypothetical protein
MHCWQCFPLHNGWGPDALTQSFLAQISLWNNFLFTSGNLLLKADKKIVPCKMSWKYTINNAIMEVKGFHALLKNWKNLALTIRCNILIFYTRHIHGYKVPLESIFFFWVNLHICFLLETYDFNTFKGFLWKKLS